jgi:hypothetical protein
MSFHTLSDIDKLGRWWYDKNVQLGTRSFVGWKMETQQFKKRGKKREKKQVVAPLIVVDCRLSQAPQRPPGLYLDMRPTWEMQQRQELRMTPRIRKRFPAELASRIIRPPRSAK